MCLTMYVASVDDVNHDQSPSDPSMLPEKLITNKGYIPKVSEQKPV